MFTLSLVMILVSSTPAHPKVHRETRGERAARLMTDVELSQLADLDRQVQELVRPGGNTALLVLSIVAMSAAVVLPVAMAVVGIVGTLFFGIGGAFAALFGSLAVWAFIPTMWVGLYAWIPVWGWIAMAAVAVVGAGMLIGAQVGDGPRSAQVHALKEERSRLVDMALTRPEQSMLQQPMTTLATF